MKPKDDLKERVTFLRTHLTSCRTIIDYMFNNVNIQRCPFTTRENLNEMRKEIYDIEHRLSKIKDDLKRE